MLSFFFVFRCRINKQGNPSGEPCVGLLALVSLDEDGSCKVLYRKIIRPQMTSDNDNNLNYRYTGVTEGVRPQWHPIR